MSWTKPEMWLSVILIVLVFAFTILAVGRDFVSSDVVLDNKSLEYVSDYSANINANNLSSFEDNATLTSKKSNPLLDLVNNLPIISDVVGGINFFIDKTEDLMRGLAIVYNLPSFFIQGFGLQLGAFRTIINIFTYVLVLAFLIIMVRLVK